MLLTFIRNKVRKLVKYLILFKNTKSWKNKSHYYFRAFKFYRKYSFLQDKLLDLKKKLKCWWLRGFFSLLHILVEDCELLR